MKRNYPENESASFVIADRKALKIFAELYGTKAHWFEPEWFFRERLLRIIRAPDTIEFNRDLKKMVSEIKQEIIRRVKRYIMDRL